MSRFDGFRKLVKKDLSGKKVYTCLQKEVNLMNFICVDTSTEEVIFGFKFPSNAIKPFIDELVLDKEIFQAIILGVYDLDVKNTGYQSRYEFRTALKAKLNQLEIPSYFMCSPDVACTTFLLAAGLTLQQDETFTMVVNFGVEIKLAEFIFTPTGYRYRQKGHVKINQRPEQIREKILAFSNSTKIIGANVDGATPISKFIKSNKLISIDSNAGYFCHKAIAEACKWILDKSNVKYHILPVYDRLVEICTVYGLNCKERDTLIEIHADVRIPCSYSAEFPRTVLRCLVVFDKKDDYCFEQDLNLDRNGCHRYETTLSVDDETMESYNVQKVTLDSIHQLPYRLGDIPDLDIPIIGLFDNSSVILTHKKCLGYDFLKAWNGIYGKDLFMSFDQKKPKYFDEAWKKLEDKPSFVVFDLLKIMSMPPEDAKTCGNMGFTITKDANNPVLLEFDNFDGTRKAASPSFLMAVFIRKHLEAIRDEIGGEKPTKIAFWILNDLNDEEQFNNEEMERIKEGLEESCKLLKINCIFVDC